MGTGTYLPTDFGLSGIQTRDVLGARKGVTGAEPRCRTYLQVRLSNQIQFCVRFSSSSIYLHAGDTVGSRVADPVGSGPFWSEPDPENFHRIRIGTLAM